MGADLEKLDSAPAKPGVEDPPSDTAKESLELGFLDDDEELEKEEQQDDETTTPRGSNHRAAWDKIEPFGDAAPRACFPARHSVGLGFKAEKGRAAPITYARAAPM